MSRVAPHIRSQVDVRIRPPVPSDRARFLKLVRISRTLHGAFAQPPHTGKRFDDWLTRLRSDRHVGHVVCTRDDDDIVGVVNINEIVRGGFQSAYLGYYAFEPHAGRGLMRQGLALVIRYAFRTLRLHRLEANIQPENQRSIALVRGLGFSFEGYSPRYLKIAGRWRDHERWALRAENWSDAAV